MQIPPDLLMQLEQHSRTVRRHAAKHCILKSAEEVTIRGGDPEDFDCHVEPLGGCDTCMDFGRAKAGPPPGSSVHRLALVMFTMPSPTLYGTTPDRLSLVLSARDDLYDFNLSELVAEAVKPSEDGEDGEDAIERAKLITVFGDGSQPIRCGGITMGRSAKIILYAGEARPGTHQEHVDVDALVRLALRTTEA